MNIEHTLLINNFIKSKSYLKDETITKYQNYYIDLLSLISTDTEKDIYILNVPVYHMIILINNNEKTLTTQINLMKLYRDLYEYEYDQPNNKIINALNNLYIKSQEQQKEEQKIILSEYDLQYEDFIKYFNRKKRATKDYILLYLMINFNPTKEELNITFTTNEILISETYSSKKNKSLLFFNNCHDLVYLRGDLLSKTSDIIKDDKIIRFFENKNEILPENDIFPKITNSFIIKIYNKIFPTKTYNMVSIRAMIYKITHAYMHNLQLA